MIPYYETKLGKLYLGDAKDILPSLPTDSIDLVFTDPPYPKSYFPCFTYLADFCPRLMKTGASLLTIVGHYQLESVMSYFQGKLKYRWIICLNQFKRNHAQMLMGIEVMWKPILWYVKEKYGRGGGFLMDGIEIDTSEGIKKELHKWQQLTDWCEYYIKKLTNEGDVVLDPYIGSGTVAIVCEKLGRRWIGIDNFEEACETTKQRLL